MAMNGFQVEIYAASTVHPSGKKRSVLSFTETFPQVNGFVKLLTIPSPTYTNSVGRIINMLSFSFRLLTRLANKRSKKPQVIIGSTVTPVAALVALLLARIHRCKFVYEIRDLWPETLIRFEKLSSNSFISIVLYKLEKLCWKRADLIISPLSGLRKYGLDRGYCEKEIIHIPNGIDASEFSYTQRVRDKGRNKRTELIYAGSLGEMYNLEPIIQALSNPRLDFLGNSLKLTIITDPCEQRKKLELLSNQNSKRRVSFEDRVSRNILWGRLNQADALVLPLSHANGLYEYGASPNKVAEYLAAGRMVIQSSSYPGSPVFDNDTGIIVETNSENDWIEGILRLVNLTDKRYEEISNNARKIARNLDFELLSYDLQSAIQKIIGDS